MTVLATEQASATAGREGRASSKDGKIDLQISPPGSGGSGTSPEQLFAAGYAACFGQAIKAMAKEHNIEIDANALNVDATVHLHKEEGKGFFISVALNAEIPGADQGQAETLVAKAHEICPYSNATRGNVEVTLQAGGTPVKAAA